jgi:glycosyltransferase involved in cell wall biosynthesis
LDSHDSRFACEPGTGARLALTRIISRLNIGGPAIQAISLTHRMEARGYRTRLVRGTEGAREGNLDGLARRLGISATTLASMGREPGLSDLRALGALVRILRRDPPQIVHTHAAKAGTLGRLATLAAFPCRRPVLVHTFHGHSLSGYFAPRTASAYRAIEWLLARHTDCLIAVSSEVRDELVGLGIAPRERFEVVRLGLDLSAFTADIDRAARRACLRAAWGLQPADAVVTLVARLVPIKRVDRFLRVAELTAHRRHVRFVVVGDGALRERLAGSQPARRLGERLVWAGLRHDMADVCFASDVVVLTSDSEGTPVSLIEAQAAALPVVSTDVGGVRTAVSAGVSGLLAPVDNEARLASELGRVLDDPALARALGRAGRVHVTGQFGIDRLVDDLDSLYRRLLSDRDHPRSRPRSRDSAA